MSCLKCNSDRLAKINAKCSDCCFVEVKGFQNSGYVPRDMNIGGGDCITFTYCMDCGQMQDNWPLAECKAEIVPERGDICPQCDRGELEFVKPDEPWTQGHLQCDRCDSTFFIDDETVQKYLNNE